MFKKRKLQIILQKLREAKKPKPKLEQYFIPGNLAAEILNIAYLSKDIKDKSVLDLGCGTGRLTIGSALLGAKKVIGIDIDEEMLRIAKENVKLAEELSGKKIEEKIKFIKMNAKEWKGKVDTVIQNPPFGIQTPHADRVFLERAIESGKKIYSLHRSYEKSREFLKRLIEKKGGKLERIMKFKFRIPYMFQFHRKPSVEYDVDLYIIKRISSGRNTEKNKKKRL